MLHWNDNIFGCFHLFLVAVASVHGVVLFRCKAHLKWCSFKRNKIFSLTINSGEGKTKREPLTSFWNSSGTFWSRAYHACWRFLPVKGKFLATVPVADQCGAGTSWDLVPFLECVKCPETTLLWISTLNKIEIEMNPVDWIWFQFHKVTWCN